MKQIWKVGILILACLTMVGCQAESQRMAVLAERTVKSQNEVNSATAKTNDNFVSLNRELQQERSNLQHERQALNKQFENLEDDRSDLHREGRSELAWSESFQFLAIVIAATMPLFLCAYLIWVASHCSAYQDEVNSFLIQEFTSHKPRLLVAPNPSEFSNNQKRIDDESETPLTNN